MTTIMVMVMVMVTATVMVTAVTVIATRQPRSGLVVLAEAIELVHAFVQDRDDADRAVA
jgi:hypothetical protein